MEEKEEEEEEREREMILICHNLIGRLVSRSTMRVGVSLPLLVRACSVF